MGEEVLVKLPPGDWRVVPADWLARLERERDEAHQRAERYAEMLRERLPLFHRLTRRVAPGFRDDGLVSLSSRRHEAIDEHHICIGCQIEAILAADPQPVRDGRPRAERLEKMIVALANDMEAFLGHTGRAGQPLQADPFVRGWMSSWHRVILDALADGPQLAEAGGEPRGFPRTEADGKEWQHLDVPEPPDIDRSEETR